MSELFEDSNFNGDISKWDVSNVRNMCCMFMNSKFNGDISKWDVSNVENMSWLFYGSKFDGDISKWDVSNVKDMSLMFCYSKFDGDISKWDVSNVEDMEKMFYKSKFDGDISKWDVSNIKNMDGIFKFSRLDKPEWYHRFYNESVGGKKMIRGSRSLTKRRRFNESRGISRNQLFTALKLAVVSVENNSLAVDLIERYDISSDLMEDIQMYGEETMIDLAEKIAYLIDKGELEVYIDSDEEIRSKGYVNTWVDEYDRIIVTTSPKPLNKLV